MINKNKILTHLKRNWPLILLVLYFSLFYFNYIFLATADLGRHIVNGREILSGNLLVLTENFYSYSQPNFSFPNHHWLFGVISYLTEQSFGFSGLTILNLLLNVGAFGFALILAKKKSGVKFAFISALLAMPLISTRSEVRPESISIFIFSGFLLVFNLIAEYFQKNKNGYKYSNSKFFLSALTILLIIGQIIWTNSHLFFIFGPLIAGLSLVNSIWKNNLEFGDSSSLFKIRLTKKSKFFTTEIKFLLFLIIGLFLVTIINPHGVSGSLSPFHIFDNYGYKVAENQSLWFLITIKNKVIKHSYFIFLVIFGLITFLGKLKLKKSKSNFYQLILFLIFGIMTLLIVRTSSFFGIIFIPIVAENLFNFYQNNQEKIRKLFNNSLFLMISSPLVISIFLLLGSNYLLFPNIDNIGIGLATQINASAEFFKDAKLSGPIFNNYDLGGYLIYYLSPEQKVFIDNRPESYSEEFLKNEYIASQENEEIWEQVSTKYQFETIYYFRLDQTDWSQKFLHQRVLDPNWVPVYFDSLILIFVKNNENNRDIIEKYKLPNEMFVLKNS